MTMILEISPIIQRIRETDFAKASTAKARAIYGILSVLESWIEDGDDLILRLMQSQPTRFLHNEQSIDGYKQADSLWASLPLKERLLRLQAFYQTDIQQLSGGDDHKAHRFLVTAERTFEQCRQEAFDTCDTHIEEFLLYFHVLCLAHPGYRHLDNVRLYLDYNRYFESLPMELYDEDSDLAWQYQEVRWRRDMLHEQHFDLSLLPQLSFEDTEACRQFRLQCYQWMLSLDPEYDGTVQMDSCNWAFVSKGVKAVFAWLNAKYTNNIPMVPEVEATALLTIYCGMNTSPYDHELNATIEDKPYSLFDRLPASKLRTHLMAHVALRDDDSELLDTAKAAIAAWDNTQLTQEDKYLIELLSE